MWGWYWGPGWIAGLISGIIWILVVILAIVFLRRELPELHRHHLHESPALRLLEERYARGEISREEFLHRREVLIGPQVPGGPPAGTQYSPRDAHVRVSQAAPSVTPTPEPDAAPPAPPPPEADAAGESPLEGRARRAGPADPTEPLPPVPPPGE